MIYDLVYRMNIYFILKNILKHFKSFNFFIFSKYIMINTKLITFSLINDILILLFFFVFCDKSILYSFGSEICVL